MEPALAYLPTNVPSIPSVRQVFDENVRYVWRVLQNLGVAPEDVEDVCQDVFLVVHRKLPTWERRGALRTWLYGICIRSAANYRRRAHRRYERRVESLPDHRATDARQCRELEERRQLERLDRVLAQLDDAKRAVFVLYEIEELTMREVAEALDCPLHTAYSRLYAARREVTAQLGILAEESA